VLYRTAIPLRFIAAGELCVSLQRKINGNGIIFSLEVDDADIAYSEAKKHSLDVVLELRSEDWGQYHFCIKDPNGIYLDIVQAIEPTEEYQQGYEKE